MIRLYILLFLAPVLCAQTATLTGRVSDESGAIVQNAAVTLADAKGVQAAVSRADGGYSFARIAPGDYTITASAPQLALPKPLKLTLHAGANQFDLQLKVTVATQQLTVQENSGPALSTDAASNANATIIRGEDLQALSDDPEDLAADLQALAGPSAGPNGGAIFVDGFSGGQLPPKESIREIRV
ncbi:MAG TPA: carboxypeptidase-like regulatory domain-containing protein, partial [Bryobacteraceae bacterium]